MGLGRERVSLHPHEGAGPRPGDEIISRGDEEPLSDTSRLIWGKRIVRERFPVAQGYARARGVNRGFAQFHSSDQLALSSNYPALFGDMADDKLQVGMIGGHWTPA